jgi:hypothetical protein
LRNHPYASILRAAKKGEMKINRRLTSLWQNPTLVEATESIEILEFSSAAGGGDPKAPSHSQGPSSLSQSSLVGSSSQRQVSAKNSSFRRLILVICLFLLTILPKFVQRFCCRHFTFSCSNAFNHFSLFSYFYDWKLIAGFLARSKELK